MSGSARTESAATYRTVCPRNCYCTCGMTVTVTDGRITHISGDPLNPVTSGRVCLKGISYARRQHDPDRILQPLRHNGKKLEPAPWDEVLDEIAHRMGRIRSESGPEAVLYHEGSGSHGALSILSEAFWRPFGGPTRTHGDLCWPAGLEADRLTYGDNRHSHPVLTRDARYILLWGHNPAETNIHQWRLIMEAREAGARIAVIDPRATDTTDAADTHLQPRPTTDAALALAMAHVIIDADMHDSRFLDRHGHGFEAYEERVREWPPDRAADICGLDPGEIRSLALAYAAARPALLISGFGLQRHHRAGQTMRAVSLLPAVTGNIGVPGGGWQYANLASHQIREPEGLPPEPEAPSRSFPTSRLGRELLEQDAPPIRAAWFEKANPASQHPRTSRVRKGLEQLELVVVVDQFLSDTAGFADYVLPAKTLFEEEDLVTAYWHPYLQLRTRIFDPPGEVRTESEVWQALCRRFGFDEVLFRKDRREVLRSMLPEGRGGMLEELASGPVDPSGRGEVAWAEYDFPTPSGKVEFLSEEAARLWEVDPIPDAGPLEEGPASPRARRYPLQLLTCKTRDRIHSQFGNLEWVEEVERPRVLDIHPADAAARGLREGDYALVWNDRGQVTLPVRLSGGIRQGVVHVIEGRCSGKDPFVNLLTDDGVTDMNHGATFYECLVEVSRP
ncbi:MAG: molybdopterin-dependent oxidoreductase [bacterium]